MENSDVIFVFTKVIKFTRTLSGNIVVLFILSKLSFFFPHV